VVAVTGNGPATVRAAGGVVWRRTGATAEVVIVHRPRYDDWSLPKGKLRAGEHPITGACREVEEEAHLRPSVGPRLPTVSYPTRADVTEVDKVVDWWAMTATADLGFTPGRETDDRSWLPVDDALHRLSYAHDARVLQAFAHLPPLRPPVVLVRHASAGVRGTWSGPDDERPLDSDGAARARALAAVLRWFDPTRLVSAPPRRCRQTLAPLARKMRVRVEVDGTFDESADPAAAAARLRALATGSDGGVVVCSQGGLIPDTLARLGGGAPDSYDTGKGQAWVLSFGAEDGHADLVALDRLP
jgi:8-oxo-dGTP diphosphatase